MIVFELIAEAIRNLRRHKLRSFLTALGIIFGIASVMSMVSTGEGARRAILEQIEELGSNNIILNSIKPPAEQKANDEERAYVQRYGLTFRDLEQIESTVPAVVRAIPVHDIKQWIWFRSRRLSGNVRGVAPEYLANLKLEPVRGRSLTDADDRLRRRVCVIRANLLREAGYVGDPLELDLRIGPDFYRVVGVLPDINIQSTNQAVLGIDQRSFEIYVPFHTAVSRFGYVSNPQGGETTERTRVELHQIVCEIRSQEDVLEAAKCIQAVLGKFHDKMDYQATVPLELLASMERAQRVFNIVLPIVAGISLLVGGIGILNIMLASITERTREIGIRRAIGATRFDITTQFLVETITLSVIGGIAGVGVGSAGVVILEQFTDWKPVVTPWAVALSLGISCTTGVVFGIYPARRAASMNPIQALRHE